MTLTMTHPAQLTDAALVPRLARGDEQALALLLDRYWRRAYGLAYRLVGEPHAAEDAAQEAFVKLLEHAGSYDPARPFRPWFFQIVANQARQGHRGRARRAEHEARATPRPTSTAASDDAEAVQACLDRLPPAQRESIALHYLGGLTLQEVADALACPLNTVASRVRRGIESLRASLEPSRVLSSTALVELLRRELAAPAQPSLIELRGAVGAAPPAEIAVAPRPDALLRATRRRPRGLLLALPAALALAAVAWLLPGGAPAPQWAAVPDDPAGPAGAPPPVREPAARPATPAEAALDLTAAVRKIHLDTRVGLCLDQLNST